MKSLRSQESLRPRTTLELFDIAFRLYRIHFFTYIRMVALLLIFVSPFVLLLFPSYATEPFEWAFTVLILGVFPVAPRNPVGVIFREVIFPDGIFFWTLSSLALAPLTAHFYGVQPKIQPDFHQLKRCAPWLLLVLVGLPIVLLRIIGLGVLSDIARIPTLLAPYILILEERSIVSTLRRSLMLMWHNLPRFIILSIITLGLVRLALLTPFILLATLKQIPSDMQFMSPETFQAWTAFLALGAEVLLYPVVHITTTLFYYDFRVRYEGLDIALLSDTKDTTE